MKNQLLLTACFLLIAGIGFSQDKQWLIKDGSGKSGLLNGANNYFYPINSTTISLEAIQHPNRTCNPSARNDIFVIYSDWSHYNSRWDSQHPDFFFPNPSILDQNQNQTKHNFTGPAGKSIKSLYLSNIYEGDDPPLNVKVKNDNSGQNTTAYVLGTSMPTNVITADHDVLKNTDITLVLKKSSINSGDALYVNKIRSPSGQDVPGDFFMVSNVFGSDFSNVTGLSIQNGKITFTTLPPGTPDYIYINLKPTNNLDPYYPNDPANPNPPVYDAVFELKNSGGSIIGSPLLEKIRDSHDPNFMQITSLCHDNSGDLSVNYHLQFENTSLQPAKKLKIEIAFPKYLNPKSIGSVIWYPNPKTSTGTKKVKGRGVKFIFKEDITVQACNAQKDPLGVNSIGGVDFCIKVKPQYYNDVQQYSNSLKPVAGKVYFDTTIYPLQFFYEPDPKAGMRKFLDDCGCKK